MAQALKPGDTGLTTGQVLLGKYRVESVLGHGGMGIVARCTHIALNESVAIKMLRRDVLTDRDAVGRFMREAQAASKLKSEYVARVSDVGEFEDGVPYMVMEFLDGHDLDALLEQRGTVPIPWACEMMLQTCEALAEAHSLGIVHRDVKPSNLFVTWRPDGSALVKVLDFGISKNAALTDMQLTQTQSLLGTPAYMSPEQMRSARMVDSRTDIWSLGTVLYELIEGRRPFEADSFSEMCVKVAVDEPTPMNNAPPLLQQVVMHCLAKTPDQRYSSVAELARDLIPFVTDAYQANKLVERMVRMLGRRDGNWDIGSNPAIPQLRALTPVPGVPIAVPKSGPLVAPADSLDTRRDRSGPAGIPHDLATMVAPHRRRRFSIVTAVAAAVAVVVGLVVLSVSSKHATTPSPVSMPVTTSPSANLIASGPDPAPPAVATPTPVGTATPTATTTPVVTDSAGSAGPTSPGATTPSVGTTPATPVGTPGTIEKPVKAVAGAGTPAPGKRPGGKDRDRDRGKGKGKGKAGKGDRPTTAATKPPVVKPPVTKPVIIPVTTPPPPVTPPTGGDPFATPRPRR